MGVSIQAPGRRGPWTVLWGLILLGAAACSGGDATNDTTSAPAAPAFSVPLYTGQSFLGGADNLALADLRGRGVVLNFWAPLCAPCRAEMPDFEELWQEVKDEDRIVVVGVDVGPYTGLGDRATALRFLDETGITYPTGQAQSGDVIVEYGVQGMPTTVFVTPDGKVARKWTGVINKAKLDELTEELFG